MPSVDIVGVVSKPRSELAARLVPQLAAWLDERGVRARLDPESAAYAGRDGAVPREQVPDGTGMVIVLGGDGTLLSAARAIGGRNIPLFAVNLGGLGFLTAITADDIFPQLANALRGELRVAPRRLLACELLRKGEVLGRYEALNDVVLTKAEIARMIDLEVLVDRHFVCVYKADGLIVATPTGTTAYSLSAGGPIVYPTVSALTITPICPHTLTHRPVVVDDASVIQVINRSEDQATYLTIDGQVGELLKRGDTVLCRRSENSIGLVQPPELMFFDVLRKKLKWGGR
jgi:NAD+ kinase